MYLQRRTHRKIIHTFSHVLSSLWHNTASCFHLFSHIHWYSECQSHRWNACRGLGISYSHTWKDTSEQGRQRCGLHPAARQMEDCLHTIWGLRHFTEGCPSRGDPAVLGAIGGGFSSVLHLPLCLWLPVVWLMFAQQHPVCIRSHTWLSRHEGSVRQLSGLD